MSIIYLDNQSTTRVDPDVMAVMNQFMAHDYGNAGSVTHELGWQAHDAVEDARARLAESLGADATEFIFTSGATESNNLAIRGLALHPRRQGNHIVTVATEHKAVLDPVARLEREGFEVTRLVPSDRATPVAGMITPDQVAGAIRDDTFLVSVMLANNEIGVIQPLKEIGELCVERKICLHTDATQAVGKMPIDVREFGVALLSFSAHKIYGPKGVGGLFVRQRGGRVRLTPLTDGGGQERGLRSGTLNVPGIVGFAKALELMLARSDAQNQIAALRNQLHTGIMDAVDDVYLNGPPLDRDLRLAGNLNLQFQGVDGEAMMLEMRNLAVSSGSACTAANPEPSHVLKALGLSDDAVRSSLRFGIGRFNTPDEIDRTVAMVSQAVAKLRAMAK